MDRIEDSRWTGSGMLPLFRGLLVTCLACLTSACAKPGGTTMQVDADGRDAALEPDAAEDAGEPDVPSAVCGDGVVAGTEGCDDGNTAAVDGCSAACSVEDGWSCAGEPSVCLRVPETPTIEGEASAGHPDPLWRWNQPANTHHFQIRLDGSSWQETTDQEYRASDLAEGDHTFEVQACNEQGACSQPGSFLTTVEYFGEDLAPVWAGAARTDYAISPLGNPVFISCHNCYNGPGNEVYDTQQALAKIHRALVRGADLIELDVALAADGATFCVVHGDPADCGDSPTLEEILSDQAFQQSDALLFVELKEQDADPGNFALMLLDLLDRHREFVRNGRPFFLRIFADRLVYLHAVDDYLAAYPFIAPYVRFSVLYGRNAYQDPGAFQQAIRADALNPGFHMVEFHYQTKNLEGLLQFARQNGLGVGLWTIPGTYGEVFVGALREEVDELTCEYRVDQARAVVAETNVLAYVNPAGCTSAGDPTVTVYRNLDGTLTSRQVSVGVPATANNYGTPPLWYDPEGQDRYGCSFDFRTSQGITERALELGDVTPAPNTGFLVAAYVNFDDLSVSDTLAVLNSSESGGFALELASYGGETRLRFGVHAGGSYQYHAVPVRNTGLAQNPSLNSADGYLLIGAYDGDGGIYLWIDNELPPGHPSATGSVRDSGQPALLGADPQPTSPLKARFFFDGLIQRAVVLRWGPHTFSGSVVND